MSASALALVYLYARVRAFQAADFSAAYPVARGTAPALTALLAIALLGETPSRSNWPGSRRFRAACWR